MLERFYAWLSPYLFSKRGPLILIPVVAIAGPIIEARVHHRLCVQCFFADEGRLSPLGALSPDVAPLHRLCAFALLLGTLIWTILRGSDYVGRTFWTTWHDPNYKKRDGDLSWQDVFDLASLDRKKDPIELKDSTQPRKYMILPALVLVLVGVAIGLMFAIGFDYTLFPRVPKFIVDKSDPFGAMTQISTNLTAYLALLGAAVSIIFTYHQLRSKVRADSRQAWINEVRKLMSKIINDITRRKPLWDAVSPHGDPESFGRLNNNRLLLELMLNPSEKDHRLLSILIRAFAIPGIRIEGDKHIGDLLREAKCKGELKTDANTELLFEIATENYIPRRYGVWEDSISYIVKLCHVVLKRLDRCPSTKPWV